MVWQKLKRPIWCLAPMEGVTDSPFRQMLVETGKPDVMFTEFVSVEGMASAGAPMVKQRLQFTKVERPIIAQLWGLKPENFYRAAKEVTELGFDGVDLNFGCPDKAVVKMGACAAMVENDRPRVKEILQALSEGVKGKIPVSVKTRIGFKKISTEEWAGFFLEQNIAALTIHGRTVKEKSDVGTHWEEIGKVVRLRDGMKLKTVIVGNGDVEDLDQAREKVRQFGVDGVMIGRGVLKNPWIFNRDKGQGIRGKEERLALLLNHVRLFVKIWRETKNFEELKKYFKIYIRDFDGAGEVREKLMGCHSLEEVEGVVLELDQ